MIRKLLSEMGSLKSWQTSNLTSDLKALCRDSRHPLIHYGTEQLHLTKTEIWNFIILSLFRMMQCRFSFVYQYSSIFFPTTLSHNRHISTRPILQHFWEGKTKGCRSVGPILSAVGFPYKIVPARKPSHISCGGNLCSKHSHFTLLVVPKMGSHY